MVFEIKFTILGILAIIAGILVLAWPKFLRYAVGIYLLLIGLVSIVPNI